jgi:plasmid stabilization system protein ParE
MPRGDKSKYTGKQERKADHIAEGYEKRGVGKKEAESRAWATVDRMIVDRAATVPYANDLQLTLLSPRVGNYQFNPQWGALLDQLWVH